MSVSDEQRIAKLRAQVRSTLLMAGCVVASSSAVRVMLRSCSRAFRMRSSLRFSSVDAISAISSIPFGTWR
jgi:hypothetical protein